MRIGIDMGGTKIEGLALGPDGAELARLRIDTPRGDYAATVSEVCRVVERLERETGDTGPVGVGIPGAVSPATGLIKNANSTCLIGNDLKRDLEAALARPVRLTNDANCFALSEAADGAGAGHNVVFGVILGTGVGAGIVVNGQVLVGPNAIAGEWGHNPLPWPTEDELPGPECYCGKHGCIETFISGPALSRQHKVLSGVDLPARDILGGLTGDIEADNGATHKEIETAFIERLSRALAHVINILDPDIIVLGGGLSNHQNTYRELPEMLPAHVFSDEASTPIKQALHGDSSGVRGAAWLWPQKEAG